MKINILVTIYNAYTKVFGKRILPFYKHHKKILTSLLNSAMIVVLLGIAWYFKQEILDALKLSITIGWGFLLLPLLFLIWNCFATAGWQSLLKNPLSEKRSSFWSLYLLRIQSQALNLILPVSGVAGEALRSVKTRNVNGLKSSTAIVVLDKIIDVASDMILALIGVAIAWKLFHIHPLIALLIAAFVITIVFIIWWWQSVVIFFNRKMKNVSFTKVVTPFLQNKQIQRASRNAFVFHFCEHILMGVEIYCAAKLIGVNLDLKELLYCNAIGSLFNVLFIIVPARAGAFECSLAFAFSQIGLAPSTGISVALIRRARQLIVCSVGLLTLTIKENIEKNNEQMSIPVKTADTI